MDYKQRRRELNKVFDKINAHMLEHCKWQHEIEFEIEDPNDRIQMVLEAIIQCYEYLEQQYNKLRVLLPSYPVIDPKMFMSAIRDCTLVKFEISDGLAYSKAKMKAYMPMSGVQDEYERLIGIPPAYEDGEGHLDYETELTFNR